MAKVMVLHHEDGVGEIHEDTDFGVCGRFGGFCKEHSALRLVYAYDTERTDLEEIWRDNNTVDGTEQNVHMKARSLSVGDVVVVQDRSVKHYFTAHAVESSGWSDVALEDVLEAAGRPARVRTRENR